MKKIFVFITACGCLTGVSFSQNVKYCGTDEAERKLRAEHPEIAEYEKQLEQQGQNKIAQPQALPPVYIIPVVFHVLHNYGPENISDAQLYDAIRILNRDFRKLNADTSEIIASFKAFAGDAEVEFRLAKKDPFGNCTNGVDRIVTPETYIGDNGSKLNQWPRNKYLNVWTVNSISSGAAGFSYYPSSTVSNPALDGVVILHDYVGSIGTGNELNSRSLTHEVGHYLNLKHPWGDSNTPGVACGDDGVGDTPMTKGWTSCNLSGSVCNPPIIENVQNYMDYAFCQRMFTADQITRMRSALLSGIAFRNNLWSAGNLTFTGVSEPDVLCTADFTSGKTLVCQGDSVQFTDNSWNGKATGWSWTFTGGTPAASTDSMPWVTYNAPGQFNVSLTSTNATGSPSVTKTNYIYVFPNTAQYNSSIYTEGFEASGPLPNSDWKIKNSAGPAFDQNASVAFSGAKSMWLNNFSATTGGVNEAYSPTINLSAITNPKLYFRVAYAQKTASDNDNLKVYVSSNCGITWVQKYSKSGAMLKTENPTTASFSPTASSQWRMDSVSLAGFLGSANFLFKFQFTPDGGNNIYIDDINIATIGTVLYAADFTGSKRVVCQGDSVQFTDNSRNGNPTVWNWTFTGGAPATSTDSIPWITYSTLGSYNVSHTVTNATGSASITKNNYIDVIPNTATYSGTAFVEGFEASGPLPNTDWKITSSAGPAWSQNTSVANTGTKSMWLDNFSATIGDVEVAYSPPIDISVIINPKLYFRVAYAQKVFVNNDSLRVLVSTDCGSTWNPRYTKSGTALSTTTPVSSSFTPSASQWRLDSVSIAPADTTSMNFMFKFEFYALGGNNIFIDDINIATVGTVGISEISNDFSFSIFPNPIENNSIVSFLLPEKQKVSLKLFDVLGREVAVLTDEVLTPGEHQYNINSRNMNKGLYFIKFMSGKTAFARKLIVN